MLARFGWFFLVTAICLPVAVLATGVRIPGIDRPAGRPRPASVPSGDIEMAWLHTSTNGPTWERFVYGLVRTQLTVPGLTVDDSNAFNETTTAVPEVVFSMADRPGKLRVRWYKLTTDATTDHWVNALAERDPAPVALIGGGSSDRAADLARAMNRRKDWAGERPLLFITTATADELEPGPDDASDLRAAAQNLIDVYDDLSFRFCFTNRQMAEAVIDFTEHNPERLATPSQQAFGGVASAVALHARLSAPPKVLSVVWKDDPFSTDLHDRFGDALRGKLPRETWEVRYSIGSFATPNFYEARTAESILAVCRDNPTRRILLILPTVTQPARRLLRALVEGEPRLRDRLVVVTGDGIPVNAFTRDGQFAWPVHALPVPVVLFTHNDPAGWDAPGSPAPPGYELRPPNTTEEVLHFARLGRILVEGVFGLGGTPGVGSPAGSAELCRRLHARSPAFFEPSGERRGGSGEYVVVLRPNPPESGPHGLPEATLDIYRRSTHRGWEKVNTLDIDQRRAKPNGPGGPS